MSEPKAQLVDPQENMNLPGMNATGVITASSFSGEGGVVTGLTGSPNLNVGVVTATSFVGDGTGHAAGLTGTPNLNLGLTTATSFIGDAVGKAAGLTGTPNLNVGLITATSFAGAVTGDVTGNITGLAASITPGNNLNVGVATGLEWYGDGSGLTGAGSSASIAQEITATGAETIIDLSDGNLIYYKGHSNTTVGFASTSPAEQITFIRDTSPTFTPSFTTGAVTIDGTDDYISIPASSEYDIGTGDFTVECWMYADTLTSSGHSKRLWEVGSALADSLCIRIDSAGNAQVSLDNTSVVSSGDGGVGTGAWTHVALCRKSSVMTLYINGKISNSATVTTDIDKSTDTFFIGANHADSSTSSWDGKISNFRYGTAAVYDGEFAPPFFDLTAVTGTKILCCQSDSSATAAADSPGTLTVNGTVTAGAATISGTVNNGTITWPSTVKWPTGTAPTLITNSYSEAFQIFHLTTGDTGASYQAWEEMKNNKIGGDYSLWSWGLNQVGELGQNAAGYPATMLSSPTQVGTDTTWSVLEGTSGNNNTSLSLKSDGTLWMWGSNSNGKLAQNNGSANARLSSPTQVGTDTNWNYVQGNRTAIFGTKTDGSLWSWGYNLNGQLGQNSVVNKSSPTQIGSETTWGKETYQLGSTWMHGAAIKTNGTLWMWGVAQYNGELAQNNITNYSSPIQVGSGMEWRSVGGGYGAVLATQTNGTLWAWGYGSYGALGLNSVTQRSSPCQVGTDTTWSKVTSYGGYSSVAVMKTDGTLWAWGGNANGQLGLNDRNLRSSPCQIPGTTWKRFDSGDNDCMGAVKTDGTLWTWGINVFGELGQNNLVRYSSPTQIPGTTWHDVSVNTGSFLAQQSN